MTFPRLWRMCSEEKFNAAQLFPSPQARSFLYISRANAAVITWGMMLAMMQKALFPLCLSYQSKTLRMTKPIQLSYVGMERLMFADYWLLAVRKSSILQYVSIKKIWLHPEVHLILVGFNEQVLNAFSFQHFHSFHSYLLHAFLVPSLMYTCTFLTTSQHFESSFKFIWIWILTAISNKKNGEESMHQETQPWYKVFNRWENGQKNEAWNLMLLSGRKYFGFIVNSSCCLAEGKGV